MLEWIHRSQPRQRVVSCTVESLSGKGKGLEESPFVAMERFNRRRGELMRDAQEERSRNEKREKATAATDKLNNVVGWASFLRRCRGGGEPDAGESNAGAGAGGDDARRAQSCPLPRQSRRHAGEGGGAHQRLLLP